MTSNYSSIDLEDFINQTIDLDDFINQTIDLDDLINQTKVLRPDGRDSTEADLLDAFGNLSEPRRGVIIVADRSWSVNKVMRFINAGLHGLCKDIADNPLSAGTVDVALVSFGTDVTVHNLRNGGCVERADFERDIDDIFVSASKVSDGLELKADGLTSLNQALLTACELEGKYAHRVREKTLKAPYKTVVVLLTDGHDEPGGDVSEAADCISELVKSGKMLFLPFGYGNYSPAEFAELCREDGMWFELADDEGKAITDTFRLIGASMRVMSEPGAVGSERQVIEEVLNTRPDARVQVRTLDDFVRGL